MGDHQRAVLRGAMELLFESRLEIANVEGRLHFFQERANLDEQPVLRGDNLVDGAGAQIYGSVHRDGGRFRMWYQAYPREWNGDDGAHVAYAESDDGQNWTKPDLGLVDYKGDGKANNLTDMGMHCPSVFIDPTAPAAARYRAAGHSGSYYECHHRDAETLGYYTLHSADGLHWHLDLDTPQWDSCDVITTVYHPGQQRAIASLKYTPRRNKIRRRCIWQAERRDGQWSPAHAALIPDDFDDVCAIREGFVTGDYYGMGMMPAGSGTVGFIWQFRHDLPHGGPGVFGKMDISLAYQPGPRDCWFHLPGRPNFISHNQVDWMRSCTYTASAPIEVGDEQWLYISGEAHSHGWNLDQNWKVVEQRWKQLVDQGVSVIGRARWPRDRLFGFHADPEGSLELNLGKLDTPSRLYLNYSTETDGHVRVACLDQPGLSLEEAQPLGEDSLRAPVAWQDTDVIPADPSRDCRVRLHLDCARIYAYEVVPV